MSNLHRRKEKIAQLEREWIADAKERSRKANLSIWERIEEADGASEDVKFILHQMAEAIWGNNWKN